MFTIWKRYTFSASHRLDGLPDGHQCSRLHGHNYIVEVELSSERLNDVGFVRDFGELAPLRGYIDETWDHRHLNDVHPFRGLGLNPTAENMAWFLYHLCAGEFEWPEVSAVRVQETPTSWAEYRA